MQPPRECADEEGGGSFFWATTLSKPATKTILIAEPNGALRRLLAFYLEQNGYATKAAASSRGVWKAMDKDQPDLLLMNMTLPKDHGIRLVQQLRGSPDLAELPVVVLTEVRDKRVVLAMAELGVEHYLLSSALKLPQLTATFEKLWAPLAPDQATATPVPEASADPSATTADNQSPEAETSADANPVSGMDLSEVHSIKDVKPLMKRSTIQDALDECGDLKGMSPAVAEVLKLTKRENCSINAVAKAVKKDQGVSLKLLKLANSSVYERGDPVDSIPKAIMRMGLNSVRQAALNLSVVDQFIESPDPRLDASLFWEHSIATGLIAAAAMRTLEEDDDTIDSAFTMGLLHDTGRMVYSDMFPDDYVKVLDVAEHLHLPLSEVESRLLLVNHAESMDRVLRAWRFPKHLVTPIALHHLSAGNIRRMAPKAVKECCVMALANALSHALLLGHSGSQSLYAIEDHLAALDLGPAFVDEIVEEIPDQTLDIKLAMLANSGGTSMDYLKHLKDQLAQPIHPLLITRDAHVDPVGIMLRRLLGEPPNDATPNLAILRLTGKKQVASMTQQLHEAEEAAGVADLPLLVLSTTGELRTADAEPSARRQVGLKMPLHVGCFIDQANAVMAEPEAARRAA